MLIRRCAAAALLLLCSLTGQTSSDTSICVWPWLVGDVDPYEAEIVSTSAAAGLDTIYVSLWRTTGSRRGSLTMRDEAGTWDSRDGQLLPYLTLSSLIRRAHGMGIQVVGVVKVFDDTVLPSDTAHQDHIVKVLRYLCNSYDAAGQPVYPLDGIAFDYVRWFGGNHSPTLVNRFLDAARSEVGTMPLHAYVIAGPYALDAGSYNNTFRSYPDLRNYLSQNYGQDWEAMARRLDCLIPMTYIADGGVYGSNLSWMEGYTRTAAQYARTAVSRAGTGCRVVLAIRTWNSPGQTTTRATVEASCRGAIRGGANGYSAFRYFTARGQASWWQGLTNYAVPGSDLPIAALTTVSSGLDLEVDPRGSRHAKFASNRLQFEADLDGDGTFDSGPVPLAVLRRSLTGVEPRVVSVRVVDPTFQVGLARMRVAPSPVFGVSQATVSTLVGGRVSMPLTPGSGQGGQRYVVFVSLTGTSPATVLGAVRVPLVPDALTSLVYLGGNTSMFRAFLGGFDSQGRATPVFDVPGGVIPATYVGTRIHFAAVGVDAVTGAPQFASNPVSVRVVF